uniref:Uncharacterized protein n=1 Tax=Laticauda laticaudata TaxID=8630 RepID=A0A8C5WMZ1_LATLA
MALEMDPLLHALSYFRRRKFQLCSDLCSQVLEKEPGDQAAWCLKMRALTEMVYVDEIEVDQEGIAEMMLDENAIAQVARKLHLYFTTPWGAVGCLRGALRGKGASRGVFEALQGHPIDCCIAQEPAL